MFEDSVPGFPSPDSGEDDAGAAVRRIQAYLEQLRRHENPQPAVREEWDRLFQLQSQIFRRLVRGHHWPDSDREDGVQELWLSLISRLREFQYEPCRGEICGWVAALVTHRLADLDRYRKNHPTERLDIDATDELAGREPDPAAMAERNQLTDLVRSALAELRAQVSERDYDAFTLRWLDGSSVREVADRLGMTEGQVRISNYRVRAKLRLLLERRLYPRPRNDS